MAKERERLRVGATTRPQVLAGAIAKFITQDNKEVEIVAVGAGAVNQATKGLIMARRFLSSTGDDYAFKPAFETITIDSKEVTAIKWIPVAL
jgi:stage V sporulation protein S